MRIAAISDIHANLVALGTVLNDLAQQCFDRLVFLGDAAVFGPQPREVVATLRTLDCLAVMGNTDDWLLNPQPGEAADENARKLADIYCWCAEQLASSDLEYLRTFRPSVEIRLDSQTRALCFHGSPASCRDVILPTTPENEVERMLSRCSPAIMIGGHTHVPMLRCHKESRIVNPGSVGLPVIRRAGRVHHPPWADYALVEWGENKLNVEFRRVTINVKAVVQVAFDSGMPHAEWWAKDWG